MKTMYVCYLFYFFTLLSEIAAEKNIKNVTCIKSISYYYQEKKVRWEFCKKKSVLKAPKGRKIEYIDIKVKCFWNIGWVSKTTSTTEYQVKKVYSIYQKNIYIKVILKVIFK